MGRRRKKLRDKGRPPRRRSANTREQRKRFLIVCEGEKTEPNYFRSFPVNADVEAVGTARNTVDVVEEALSLKDKAQKNGAAYDFVWVVFDKDDFPAEKFNEAVRRAEAGGIGVACSNQAFELWYVLHFDYLDSSLSRKGYQKILSERLGRPYRKHDMTLYDELSDGQERALRNAQRLRASYDLAHPNPAQHDPCTRVYLLVEQLNKHRRP